VYVGSYEVKGEIKICNVLDFVAVGLERETASRHEALTADFLKLYKELVAEGLFEPSIPHIVYRISELVIMAALGLYLISAESWGLKLLGILSFSMFQGRSGWLMHEGGHHSLTGNSKVDRFIQAVVYGKLTFGDGFMYCAKVTQTQK
jgi:fatty acid desaturase